MTGGIKVNTGLIRDPAMKKAKRPRCLDNFVDKTSSNPTAPCIPVMRRPPIFATIDTMVRCADIKYTDDSLSVISFDDSASGDGLVIVRRVKRTRVSGHYETRIHMTNDEAKALRKFLNTRKEFK